MTSLSAITGVWSDRIFRKVGMGRVHRPWFAQWSEAVGASVQSGSAEETPPSATATPPDAGAVIAAGPRLRVGQPFDPKAAVLYGQFVQAAYSMYGAAPNNLTPPPSPDFPAGYNLVAWVQMQDFIIGSTGPTFYGFNPNQFALAIRGTSNGIEWWDDQPRTR